MESTFPQRRPRMEIGIVTQGKYRGTSGPGSHALAKGKPKELGMRDLKCLGLPEFWRSKAKGGRV